ncbi:hypothetical protein GC194_00555 [bacterium]|nr:hypothetical protein [bacterium]
MKQIYLLGFLLFSPLFFAVATAGNPGEPSEPLTNIDIKYNEDISGYVLKFPDFANYRAILFQNDSSWQYMVFYKDVMVQNRSAAPDENLLFVNATDALKYVLADVKKHQNLLLALEE